MKLEDATVFITGANGGIGKALIKSLQLAGVAKIYAGARKVETLAGIKAGDRERIFPIEVDITNPDRVSAVAAQCQDTTLLINNAGVSRETGVISAPNLGDARLEMETNYFGTMAMCRAFTPVLKANGGGAILNILSLVSKITVPFIGTYCASKAAELSLTQCVRAELESQGTLVVASMPSTVDTPFAKNYPSPKISPDEVAQVSLHAVINDIEDVYPGEQAFEISTQLLKDPKGVEKYVAGLLPELYPFA